MRAVHHDVIGSWQRYLSNLRARATARLPTNTAEHTALHIMAPSSCGTFFLASWSLPSSFFFFYILSHPCFGESLLSSRSIDCWVTISSHSLRSAPLHSTPVSAFASSDNKRRYCVIVVLSLTSHKTLQTHISQHELGDQAPWERKNESFQAHSGG